MQTPLSRRRFVVLAAASAAATASGCYRRVVGAKGFGADESMKVHKPNAPASTAPERQPASRRSSP